MSENNNKHIKTYVTKDYVDGLVPRPIKLYVLDGSETFTIKPGNNLFDESAVVHVYENANIENLINMETLCGEFTFIYNGETKTVNLLLDGYSYLNPGTSQYCFNFSSDFVIDDNHMGYAVFGSEYDRMIDSGAEVSAQSAVTDYETIQENNLDFTIYDMNTNELAFAEITKVIIYANTYENTIKSDMIENVKWKQIMDQPYYIKQIANGGAYPLSICEFNQLMDGYDLEEVNHVLNASHPDYASHNGNITYNASMKCVTFPSVEGWKGLYFENIGQYETYKMGFLVFKLTQYDGRCDIKIIHEIVWDSGEVAVDETDFVKTENDDSTVEVSMFTDLVSGVSGKATRNLWLLVNTHGDSATIYNSRFVGQKMNSADLLLGWTNMKKYVNDTIAQASIGGEVDTSGFALKTDIPTKTSQLTNDSGFLTAHQDISGKADKTELHNHNNKTVLDTITNDMMTKWNKALPFEDSYVADCNTWLTNGYTKVSSSDTVNHPSQCTGADKCGILFFVAENATQGTGTQMYFPIDGTYKGRVFVRSMTNRSPGAWTLLSTFSGNYNDLTNKPTIPTIPTNISAFNNDSGYITSIPSEYVTETELNSKDYATKNYVDNQNNEIEKLLNDGKANSAKGIQSMLISKGTGGDNPYLIGNYIKNATYKNGTVGNTILRYINSEVNLSGIKPGDYYKISFNNNSVPEKNEIIQCYDPTESGTYFFSKTLNVSINETSSVIRVRLIKDKQVDANGSEIDAIGKCYIQLMLAGASTTEENIAVFDETLFGLEFYTPNFLPRNNMLEYAPTEDYHPATKKYVDDNKSIKFLTDAYGTASSWKADINSMEAGFDYKFPPDATKVVAISYRYIDSTQASSTKNLVVFTNNSGKIPVIHMSEKVVDSKYVIMIGHEMKVQLDVKDNGDGTKSVTVTKTPLTLSISNTIEYEPTTDYNPATKKYVDANLEDKASTEYVNNMLSGLRLVQMTKAEYEALAEKDPSVLYIIIN